MAALIRKEIQLKIRQLVDLNRGKTQRRHQLAILKQQMSDRADSIQAAMERRISNQVINRGGLSLLQQQGFDVDPVRKLHRKYQRL